MINPNQSANRCVARPSPCDRPDQASLQRPVFKSPLDFRKTRIFPVIRAHGAGRTYSLLPRSSLIPLEGASPPPHSRRAAAAAAQASSGKLAARTRHAACISASGYLPRAVPVTRAPGHTGKLMGLPLNMGALLFPSI